MEKQALLKLIAEKAYDVGFGAKKHFASYDIICKMPYWISFFVLAAGVIQMGYPDFPCNKEISIGLIIVSIASVFLNKYSEAKDIYNQSGISITQQFNELKKLYFTVRSSTKTDFVDEENLLNKIESSFYNVSVSKQVFMSDWYAHIKFFYQFNIDWIDEELHFKFLKDKVPGSIRIFIKGLVALICAVFIGGLLLILLLLLLGSIKYYFYEYITNLF